MTSHQYALLSLLRSPAIFSEMPVTLQEGVLRALRRAGLLPWLHQRLVAAGSWEALAENVQGQLLAATVAVLENNRRILWELTEVAQVAKRVAIPLLVLKGAAYLLLEIPGLTRRPMADLDLLVGEDQVESLWLALQQEGWMTSVTHPYDLHYYRHWMHQLPPIIHSMRHTEVDIHHRLLPRTHGCTFAVDALWQERQAVSSHPGLYTLSERDLVVHGMVQLFQDGELARPLRDLVDMDSMLRHFAKNEEFWWGVWQRVDGLGVQRSFFYTLRYCHNLLQTPVPSEFLTKGAPLSGGVVWLMDRLLRETLLPPPPWPKLLRHTLCQSALVARGHWLRMPLSLLIPHLLKKGWRRTGFSVIPKGEIAEE